MSLASTDSQLADALRTVAVNSSYSTSRALSKWLRRGVRLTTDGFRSTSFSEASSLLGSPDDVIVAIRLPLDGDLSGDILLTFQTEAALRMVDILMQQPEGTAQEFGESERSCLQETGTIVAGAYTNSLAKWLNLQVRPCVPAFAHDTACSILDPLLGNLVLQGDELYFAATEFMLEKQRLHWGLTLLPSPSSLRLMEARCRLDPVRPNALRAVAAEGAFKASRALSEQLQCGVRISAEGFRRVSLSDVVRPFDEDEPIAVFHMPLEANGQGHALSALTEKDALRLADLVLLRPVGTGTRIGELEQSCLLETSNLVARSFISSWSNWLEMAVPSIDSAFLFDLPEAVMNKVLAADALVGDEAFLVRSKIVVHDQSLEWLFVLIPASSTLRCLEDPIQ